MYRVTVSSLIEAVAYDELFLEGFSCHDRAEVVKCDFSHRLTELLPPVNTLCSPSLICSFLCSL